MHGLGSSETKARTKIHFSDCVFDKLELYVKQKIEKVTETLVEKVLIKQTPL